MIIPLIACLLVGTTLAVQSADPSPSPKKLQIMLPERIPAVPGVEANIYFDNIFLTHNLQNYTIDVECRKGRQQEDRWTFLPTAQDIGPHPFSIVIRDEQNNIVGQAKSTIDVLPAAAGESKEITLLTIGDSLTQPMLYQGRLLELCKAEGNPSIRLIGHCPSDEYPHFRTEGYGGWTAERFATHFVPGPRKQGDWRVWNDSGSPFLYADGTGKSKLDFAQFCKEFNDGKAPDIVTIFLGINDMLTTTDENLEATLDKMFGYYDALVRMVRDFSPTTKIGIFLPPPPAASQDAFGENYQSGLTRWQYRQRQHHLLERLISQYGNRESESLFIIPTHLNLDTQHNYPTIKAPANAHSKVEVTRQNNAVHPDISGQYQIGDTLFAWIKAKLKDT